MLWPGIKQPRLEGYDQALLGSFGTGGVGLMKLPGSQGREEEKLERCCFDG